MKIYKLIILSFYFGAFAFDINAQEETVAKTGNKIEFVRTSEEGEIYDILEKDRSKNINEIPVPHFAVHTLDNKFVMTIGAQINPIIGTDWGNNLYKQEDSGINFIPSLIPVPSIKGRRSDFYIDGLNATVDMQIVGFGGTKDQITGYIKVQTDGNSKSIYLDKAFIKWRGFGLGLKPSLFDDEKVVPPNIDPQGPGGMVKTTVSEIGYSSPSYRGFSYGIGIDIPDYASLSGIYWGEKGEYFGKEVCDPDYYSFNIPDIPMFIEWEHSTLNRVRLSAIIRPKLYKDLITDSRQTSVGWGLSLSGNYKPADQILFYLQATYGKGIGEYIQDLASSPFIYIPNNKIPGYLKPTPMMGWMAAVTYDINSKWELNAMASQARIWNAGDYAIHNDAEVNTSYTTYIGANAFYNISSYFQLGLEYLYGYRKTWNSGSGHDNRLQFQIMFLL